MLPCRDCETLKEMKTQQKMKLFTAASGSLLLAASMPLSAQDAAAPAAPAAAQTNAAPKMTMAERKQSIICGGEAVDETEVRDLQILALLKTPIPEEKA